MDQKRKRMSLVGVVLALCVIVSACSSGGGGSGGSGSSAGGTSEAPSGDANQQSSAPLELKIVSSLYNEVPQMDNTIWSEIQERTNTKLNVDWVPASDYLAKLDLLLASGDLPDILVLTDTSYLPVLNAIKQGVFWELSPFLGDYSEYPNLKNVVLEREKYLMTNGVLYTLPRTRGKLDVMPLIRTDWLEKLGLPIPTTMDEYAAALKQIVDSDPDGNGNDDTIGLGFYDAFAGAFGTWDPTYNEEGGIIHPSLTDDYADFVAWYRDRYADGVMAKEFSVMKDSQVLDLFRSGVIASHFWNIYHAWDGGESIRKVQPEADVKAVMLEGPKGYPVPFTKMTTGGIMIPKSVPEDKVKQILKFYDMTSTQEMTDLITYGIEGVHFTMEDGVRKMTDVGIKEINVDVNQPMVLAEDKWLKVVHPQAPKEWNEAQIKQMEEQRVEELGKVRLEMLIFSETWLKIWPKYSDEWEAMRTKAIIGEVSMDEYKAYVAELREMPDFKAAFKEFADSYVIFEE